MSWIGKRITHLFDKAQESAFDDMNLKDLQKSRGCKKMKTILRLVDSKERTIWKRGWVAGDGKIVELEDLDSNKADVILWTRPGILIAVLKGRILRKGGGYFPYDIQDALLYRDIKYWSKRPIAGDIDAILDLWEKIRDRLAAILLEEGYYKLDEFGTEVGERLI